MPETQPVAASDPQHGEKDDESSWIPLPKPPTQPMAEHGAHGAWSSSLSSTPGSTGTPMPSVSSATMSLSALQVTNKKKSLQQRLETRMNLKENLVDHPIDLFWKRYLVNLARELWELELHIRIGLYMIVAGMCLRLFIFSTWYFWYPRLAFLSIIFLLSVFYLDPFDFRVQLGHIQTIMFSPEMALDALDHLDTVGLRRLSFILLLIPTALEVRTFSFLSQIKAESGWVLYNFLLAAILSALMMYLFKMKHWKARECIYQALLVLYGSALLVTIVKTDLSRMPLLAAPFLSATGTLLITYRDDDMEWISRILRHALRLTLRDVLASISEKVTEDEMLQLAILRWIADYWASTPDSPPSSSTTGTDDTTPATRPNVPSSATQAPQPSSTQQTQSATSANSPQGPTQANEFPRHEIQWDELLPMLNVATDHMTSEAQLLQSGEGATQDIPPSPSQPSNQSTFSSSQPNHSTDPFEDLKNMLTSLNIDDRAEPAVRAYRRTVESFPPQKRTAVVLAVLRRCPASITLVLQIIFGSKSLVSSAMILLPFVLLEYFRILAWIETCAEMKIVFGTHGEATESEDSWGIPSELVGLDAMAVLLSGDTFNVLRPPALLLVWQNVVGSVHALEVGLTAARCAETTAVAVQFAANVMSLVQFGHEIHQNGWLHGLAVMAAEVLFLHTLDADVPQQDPKRRESTKYTSAALDAVQNAQKVAKNVHTLAEDDKIGVVVQPIVSTLCTLSGYGWLWGQNNDRPADEPDSANSEETDDRSDAQTSSPSPSSKQSAVDGKSSENVGGAKADSSKFVHKETSTSTADQRDEKDHSVAMDLLSQAFEKGLIDEVEKNNLLEKLSGLPGRDPTVVAAVKKTLEGLMEHRNSPKNEKACDGLPSTRKNPSTVMELILTAYYRGLIDKDEKNAFCEKIVLTGRAETISDQEILEGMVRTLEAIIAEGSTTDRDPLDKVIPTEDAIVQKHQDPCPKDEQELPSQPETESGNTAEREVKHVDQTLVCNESSTGDQAFVAPKRNEGIAGASSVNTTEGLRNSGVSDDGTDAWVKYGIAGIGVVLGGVLLSLRGANERAESSRQEETQPSNNASTVQIEELEDEVEEEWVAVSDP